jgi:hypothetical protein
MVNDAQALKEHLPFEVSVQNVCFPGDEVDSVDLITLNL